MLNTKLVLIIILGINTVACRYKHFYRKDYTYNENFDAYYKLHWDTHGVNWTSAFLTCYDEGANLFYPKQANEWTVVKNLTIPVTKFNATNIFVGIHDEFGLGEFITVDGHSTPAPVVNDAKIHAGEQNCVLLDIETGIYQVDTCFTEKNTIKPFICKKTDDESCPTIDSGYKYSKDTKKCYKVNNRMKTWQEAMHTCYMEGALLLVVDNQAESHVMLEKIKMNTAYFAGFHRLFEDGELYTVKGQKLEDGAYQQWYDNRNGRNNDCGIIYKDSDQSLYTSTANCNERSRFICEMQVKV